MKFVAGDFEPFPSSSLSATDNWTIGPADRQTVHSFVCLLVGWSHCCCIGGYADKWDMWTVKITHKHIHTYVQTHIHQHRHYHIAVKNTSEINARPRRWRRWPQWSLCWQWRWQWWWQWRWRWRLNVAHK